MLLCILSCNKSTVPLMNQTTPSVIIVVDKDGVVEKVLSDHFLTYKVLYTRCDGTRAFVEDTLDNPEMIRPREVDYIGKYKGMMREIGKALPPTEEFDPDAVLRLCSLNLICRKAFERSMDFKPDSYTTAPESWHRTLRMIYNTFIRADKALQEQYLKVQQ